MLKNISNLGKTLNKAEQQSINGGKLQAIEVGGFRCYCQWTYLGIKDSALACVEACNACTAC